MSKVLEAGPELDTLVAEKVMGWKSCHDHMGNEQWDTGLHIRNIPENPTMKVFRYGPSPWSPSTDIASAWEVVEKLKQEHGYSVSVNCAGVVAPWGCEINNKFVWESTVPLAICCAALAAVEQADTGI